MASLGIKYPMFQRPTPIYDFLKTRPTLVIKEPLVKKLGGFVSSSGVRGLKSLIKTF